MSSMSNRTTRGARSRSRRTRREIAFQAQVDELDTDSLFMRIRTVCKCGGSGPAGLVHVLPAVRVLWLLSRFRIVPAADG